jgi:hypothetical protein
MGLLSSLEWPHWLMIAGVDLVAIGSLGLAFTRNKEAATSEPPVSRPRMPAAAEVAQYFKPQGRPMTGMSSLWTPEEDARLRKLALEGRTAITIAERLKRRASSVRHRAAILKIVVTKDRSGRRATKRPGMEAPK